MNHPECVDIVVEPAEILHYGILGARVLVRNEREVQIKLINTSSEPVTVSANTTVGFANPAYAVQQAEVNVANYDINKQSAPIEDEFELGHLGQVDKMKLISLLREHEDVFLRKDGKLGFTNKVEHQIIVEDVPPIAKAPYRVPHTQRKILKEQIDQMLQDGIIECSDSPWSAPVIMVAKKGEDGTEKVRVCIDFRALNAVTKRDYFPIPRLHDVLDQLGKSTLFSTLDLASGYWQISVEEKSRPYSAFSTPDGHYHCLRMPFGLANSPSTWCRLMATVMSGLSPEMCFVYLDDIVVFSSTGVDQHLQRLKTIFSRMREANLKFKPSKCKLMVKETKYLGHVINTEGVQADPEKIEVIQHYPVPRTVKDIRAFLGLVGFYRRFIPEFSAVAKPLTALTSKHQSFEWNDRTQGAFEKLRNALCTKPVLRHPDFSQPFILSTDASGYAISAILSQNVGTGEHPIAYASRQLNKAEQNYSTTERECLAVVWGIKHFRCFLYGNEFKVITDHRPLSWLRNLKDPSSRLARWSLLLSEYRYEIVHRPGRKHGNADALSRVPIAIVNNTCEEITPIFDRDELIREQTTDLVCQDIRENLKIKMDDGEYYEDNDGLLLRIALPPARFNQILVPKSFTKSVMRAYHDSPMNGHQGVNKTHRIIKFKYYWRDMASDIKQYVESCISCNERKAPPNRNLANVQEYTEVTAPFERVHMDIVGPFVTSDSGNKYVLSYIDAFSRYPELIALPDQKADTIARAFVKNIICRHGCPKVLITDNGTNFLSKVLKETCKFLNVQKIHTTAYHAASNGMIERFHRTFKSMLSHYVQTDQRNWDEWLEFVTMAYRNSIHSATGETPFFLVHGRDMDLPFESIINQNRVPYNVDSSYAEKLKARLNLVFRDVIDNNKAYNQRRNEVANRKRSQVNYKLGDKVYLSNPAIGVGLSRKLAQKWIGPYRITEVKSPVVFKIKEVYGRKEKIVHADRLKICNSLGLPFAEGTQPNETAEPVLAPEVAPEFLLGDVLGLGGGPPGAWNDPQAPTVEPAAAEHNEPEEPAAAAPAVSEAASPAAASPERYQTRSRGPAAAEPWVSRSRI